MPLSNAEKVNLVALSTANVNAVNALTPDSAPAVGVLHSRAVNPARAMAIDEVFHAGIQYNRYQSAKFVFTPQITLLPWFFSMAGGGVKVAPSHPQYGVVVRSYADWEAGKPGKEIGRYVCNGTEASNPGHTWTSSPTALSGFPEGDYMGEFVAYDAAGNPTPNLDNPLPFHFYYGPSKNPAAQTNVIAYVQSYEWVNSAPVHYVVKVPVALRNARPRPRKTRTISNFSTAVPMDSLYRHDVVPVRPQGVNRPCKTVDGFWTMANKQGYFADQLRNPLPEQALLDGPRGIANGGMQTWIWIGRNLGKYCMEGDGTALVHYLPDDTRVTLAGWRDKAAPYWVDIDNGKAPWREMVGDWSAIPNDKGRRQIVNSWGAVFDPRTTAKGQPGNPIINGEVVHDGDVILYGTDRWGLEIGPTFGRLLEFRFNGRDPNRGTPLAQPPKIREILPIGALNDPWGIAWNPADGLLYVCERGAHSITKVKPPTIVPLGSPPIDGATIVGRFIDGSAQAPALGKFYDAALKPTQWQVPYYRHFVLNAGVTQAQARAVPIMAPEAIEIKDGYIVWSSLPQMEVRRSKDGFTVEKVCAVSAGTGKNYHLNFSISDGTFGPNWTVGCCHFDNTFFGPELFLPTPGGGYTNSVKWNWHKDSSSSIGGIFTGKGGVWDSGVYPMIVRFAESGPDRGGGMMVFSDTMDGLIEISLAQPGEVTPNPATMSAANNQYYPTGLRLIYGANYVPLIDVDPPTSTPELAYAVDYSKA